MKKLYTLTIAAFLILTSAVILLLPGCETDFDVNEEWKDITVVYGLLNQNDSVHYVKINKAFLGEGNAYDMAKVRDSVEYKSIDARIDEINEFGDIVSTYPLQKTIISDKEDGDFHGPEQTVYTFEADLNEDFDYRLTAIINPDSKNPKTVTATTSLVDDFSFDFIFRQLCEIKTQLATVSAYNDALKVKWKSAEFGKLYQLTIIFNYEDVLEDSITTIPRKVHWSFSPVKSKKTSGGEDMKQVVPGEQFYQTLQNNIPAIGTEEAEGVLFRRPVTFDFVLSVAAEELATYYDVNKPSEGIVQHKPEYTNVENGIGIFSSRYSIKDKKKLCAQSLTELKRGEIGGYTEALGFEDPINPPCGDPENCPN